MTSQGNDTLSQKKLEVDFFDFLLKAEDMESTGATKLMRMSVMSHKATKPQATELHFQPATCSEEIMIGEALTTLESDLPFTPHTWINMRKSGRVPPILRQENCCC